MSEAPASRPRTMWIPIAIGAAVLVAVCLVVIGVLVALGPAIGGLPGGALNDGGQCAKAVAGYQAPPGTAAALGAFDLPAGDAVISAQNAAQVKQIGQLSQSGPRFDQRLSLASADKALILPKDSAAFAVMTLSHDATRLIIVESHPQNMDSSALRVCDYATGRQINAFISDETTNAAAFTPDDSRYIVNEGRGTIAIYDTQTNNRIDRWDVRQGKPWRNTNQMVISPDGGLVFFDVAEPNGNSAYTTTILVWDVAAGKQVAELHGHTHLMIDMAITADGTRLVSYNMDGTVRVWGAP